MTYVLSIRALAEQDLIQAIEYYESEQVGLGKRFHQETLRVLQRIAENPRLYPLTEKPGYRKATLDVFPYCVYYCVRRSQIVVTAFHCALSDPRRWRERAL